ncbi:MAG: sugar ABC transporter permease [Chloroflexi bacterium]|nr:sugar ABC transporter permease [Chloroflexota bacterium]
MRSETKRDPRPRLPAHRGLRLSKRQFGILLVLPSFLIVFVTLVYPLVYSIYITFHDMNVTRPAIGPQFVGFDNYVEVLQNKEFWQALLRTAYFVLYDIFVGMPLGLAIALLLNQRFAGRGIVRALILIPYVLPGTVNGLLWKWIYNSDYGSLNALLQQLGLIQEYIPWLSRPTLALHMLILANLWQGTPFAILLYLAGLQTIPRDLYEAATVDGASAWQSFRNITLPLLTPITLVMAVLKTIATFKIFDIVYVLTGGGPANSTQVVSYYIFINSFKFLNIGLGAAMSYVLTLIILGLVIIYYRLLSTEVSY